MVRQNNFSRDIRKLDDSKAHTFFKIQKKHSSKIYQMNAFFKICKCRIITTAYQFRPKVSRKYRLSDQDRRTDLWRVFRFYPRSRTKASGQFYIF